MANYFYDLPDEIINIIYEQAHKIYEQVHKQKMKQVFDVFAMMNKHDGIGLLDDDIGLLPYLHYGRDRRDISYYFIRNLADEFSHIYYLYEEKCGDDAFTCHHYCHMEYMVTCHSCNEEDEGMTVGRVI